MNFAEKNKIPQKNKKKRRAFQAGIIVYVQV
jgi:hypothetical protein